MSFKQKVVWITGASGGIGKVLAYVFSNRSARLILSSKNESGLLCVKNTCSGEKIIQAILKKWEQSLVGPPAKYATIIKRFLPGVFFLELYGGQTSPDGKKTAHL